MTSPENATPAPADTAAPVGAPATTKPKETITNEWPVRPTPIFRLAYPWMRLILLVLARFFSPRFHISGTRNVPRRGALLLAPNHISDADPPYVQAASPRFVWFMAKEEIFQIRVLGPAIKFFGAFPVEPNGADRAALRHAGALLDNKQAVVIFPEGRCSVTGELEPMLPGAAMMALRSGVPIVPVGVWNTTSVIPYGSVIPRPALDRVAVHFGPPLHFDDLKTLGKREAREIASERLFTAIAAAREVARKAASS